MDNNSVQQPDPNDPQVQKDPETWTTGKEAATEPQKSYLQTLGQQTGEHVDDNLTKAEASEKIEELQQKREESDVAQKSDGYDIETGDDPNLNGDDDAHAN